MPCPCHQQWSRLPEQVEADSVLSFLAPGVLFLARRAEQCTPSARPFVDTEKSSKASLPQTSVEVMLWRRIRSLLLFSLSLCFFLHKERSLFMSRSFSLCQLVCVFCSEGLKIFFLPMLFTRDLGKCIEIRAQCFL